MNTATCSQLHADHSPAQDHRRSERATTAVLVLTLTTMVVEIVAGWWTGSMALLADGWHMAMHTVAMAVAVFAYRFARRNRDSARYSFGAGKAADLGAFANAVMLAVVAMLVAGESVQRLASPSPIDFTPALWIAVVGLAVNLLSAWLLRDEPHDHGDGHAHDHGHDHNREAAFIHVVSDALTSVLAIVALLCGRRFGWTWLDPATGLLGAIMILRWSVSLIRRSGAILLDASPESETTQRIRAIVTDHGDQLHDLHVWPIAAGRYAVAVSASPTGQDTYREAILALPGVAHLTLDRSDGGHLPGMGRAHDHHHGHPHRH